MLEVLGALLFLGCLTLLVEVLLPGVLADILRVIYAMLDMITGSATARRISSRHQEWEAQRVLEAQRHHQEWWEAHRYRQRLEWERQHNQRQRQEEAHRRYLEWARKCQEEHQRRQTWQTRPEYHEKIIERQVLMTRCRYCGELTPVDLTSCRNCGARIG